MNLFTNLVFKANVLADGFVELMQHQQATRGLPSNIGTTAEPRNLKCSSDGFFYFKRPKLTGIFTSTNPIDVDFHNFMTTYNNADSIIKRDSVSYIGVYMNRYDLNDPYQYTFPIGDSWVYIANNKYNFREFGIDVGGNQQQEEEIILN